MSNIEEDISNLSISNIILSQLMHNEDYTRKVLPFLKSEYFDSIDEKHVFKEIESYFEKYSALPSKEALIIQFEKGKSVNQDQFEGYCKLVQIVSKTKTDHSYQWLLDNTEVFCKDKAVYNAIMDSIQIIQGNEKKSAGEIPDLLKSALSVSFDTHVGHDYFLDSESRYEFYHREEEKLEFDIDLLNKATRGGVTRKSLNCIMAATGVGKTAIMCHLAGMYMQQGKKVLYITLEMAEERISERVEANLLNIPLDDLGSMQFNQYTKSIQRLRDTVLGELIIKEYPTVGAHVGHFRALVRELELKKNFKPDVILVDYLSICLSSRIKDASNSYSYIKAIAEELRGLAVETNTAIWTGVQVNRGGFNNTDIELTDTSESIGITFTMDYMFAAINSEELEKRGQIILKHLKNRYGDLNKYKKIIVGIDRSRMKLYNVTDQDTIEDSKKLNTQFNTKGKLPIQGLKV